MERWSSTRHGLSDGSPEDGTETHRWQGSLPEHSGCGCRYANRERVALIKSCGIRTVITEPGDPKDNAQVECISNTMKNELLRGKTFPSIGEVIASVAVAVDFYNNH